MHPLTSPRLGLCLLACLGAHRAWAQDTPPLTLTAAYTAESDETVLPGERRSERIGLGALGLQFHTVQGLQALQLEARLVHYQYQTDTAQDHTEANYSAAWQWALTPRLRGNLDASQQETPRADALSAAGSGPNRQTQIHQRADAEYAIDGPWHVVAGAVQDQHTSQYLDPSSTDSRSHTRDLGLRYDFASGSTLTLSQQATDGSYLLGSSADDNAYAQQAQDLRLHAAISAASSIDLYLTQVARTHAQTPALDFRAGNYGANANWALSGRSALLLGYAHTHDVVLLPRALWTVQDSLSWGWNWQITSRTQLRLQQALQHMDYRDPADGSTVQTDIGHDSSLSLLWTPGTQWQISAALRQQAHGASQPGLDYHTQQVSLSAQFSY